MNINILMVVACALLSGVSADENRQERVPAKGFAVYEEKGSFQPFEFTRRAVGDGDVQIEILYAGICHSDLHHVRSEWGKEEYPMVPGHEIVGRVVGVGKDVTSFKVGDMAGVGCMVDSCSECPACVAHKEQYCKDVVLTYHSHDRFHGNELTQGGYSDRIVVAEKFAVKIPQGAHLEKVAPLLCAGITTYSPLRYAGVKKGDKVGVAGFGGLGHMAVQYAVALGAEVTVFDVSEEKRGAASELGAVRYVNVNKPSDFQGLDGSFDFIISTIPSGYDPAMYLKMLKMDGQMAIVGLPAFDKMPTISLASLIFQGNRKVFGSQIGGIRETQEMLDYSVENGIYPWVEMIEADAAAIDEAYRKVLDGAVKFRYVIDMKTMK